MHPKLMFRLTAALTLAFSVTLPGAGPGIWGGDQSQAVTGSVVGFVLEVRGSWQLVGPKQLIEVGTALPPGGVLMLVSGEASQSEVRVALTKGREASSCAMAAGGERRCANRLELPRGREDSFILGERIQLALKRSFSTGPRRLVTTISRGILSTQILQSAPLAIDAGQIDLSGLFLGSPQREYQLTFSALPDQSVVFRCIVRAADPLWCKPAMVSGREVPSGHLFQVTVEEPAWMGGALIVDKDAFPAVDAEFRRMLNAVSAWDAKPSRARGPREVVLELLAEQQQAPRPPR
jgi:hypothetical protein